MIQRSSFLALDTAHLAHALAPVDPRQVPLDPPHIFRGLFHLAHDALRLDLAHDAVRLRGLSNLACDAVCLDPLRLRLKPSPLDPRTHFGAL